MNAEDWLGIVQAILKYGSGWVQWFTPVLPVTREAEDGER
jgi:hypothetical protein